IDLDGVDIPVRENLWWALRHLQLDDEPRILWIDAICINQTDTEERNYQVSRMDYIYHSASRCIAWVGMPEIGPDLGVEDCGPAMNFITRANLDQGKNTPPSILSEQDRRELDSLESLCRRRYWSRLWIIQEILLSKSVHIQCGPHYVLWQSLRYIFNNLKACLHVSYQFSITCSAPFRLGQAAFHRDAEPGLASPLADLTLQFKGSQCEDPRDNVFGLLGLTRHCCRDAVPTDYSM
ncbi:heterokaryon incompatibility protein-domain-containing protein, partial [Cadophora sp. MPI-SDFR-AT-0126]